jgi:hypothetical protein
MRQAGVVFFGAFILLAVGAGVAGGQAAPIGQPAPDIAGELWINSAPLTLSTLRGQVVLVEFWTYG